MADGEVIIGLRGEDADLARRLDDAIRKEEALGRAAESASRQSVRGSSQARDAMGRFVRQTDKAAGALAATGRESEKTFGRGIEQLKSYAMGMVSFTSAINVGREALRAWAAEQEAAAQRARSASGGLGSLVQLAGNEGELNKLVSAAQATSRESGVPLNEAARQIFELESAGALGERAMFAQLGSVGVDPAAAASGAATLRAGLGVEETGSFRDLISKALAASPHAGRASADQILTGASRSAAPARLLGISDEELLAAQSLLTEATGSPDRGATQLNALLSSLTKRGGFEGMDLLDSIKAVQSQGLSSPDLIKFFGREEALGAFSALANNKGKFSEALADISAGQAEDLVGSKFRLRDDLPALRAVRLNEASEQVRAQSREAAGLDVEALDAQSGFNLRQSDRTLRGATGSRTAAEMLPGALKHRGADASLDLLGEMLSNLSVFGYDIESLPGSKSTRELLESIERRLVEANDASRPTTLVQPGGDRSR